ncbi:MAG TPA: arginine--tRNA ligase [Polyangiaceae bacterium]|jgi:arginyl-tRNA synthetase|nr:arginine--tRNA ligase [Polyangiaceae bacterium]
MADPETKIRAAFQRAQKAAFGGEYGDVDPAIRASQHADYQANAAMSLKAKLGKPPRDIAAAIVAKLDAPDVIAKADIAGPGFINVTLADAYLSRELRAVSAESEVGLALVERPDTVVIDYSSPNVAKEMHVGHLRSTILGDALSRVLEALGNRVIRQNHLGDWGTPFGMLIEHLLDVGEGEAERSMGELKEFYQAARRKFDADEGFAERSRRRVVSLQGGDVATLALWRRLVDATLRHASGLYEKLGVRLTSESVAGESFYNPMLADVVKELVDKGLAVESDGALCVFPPGFAGREGAKLPLIVRKQDGGYSYATTDLAAIRYRVGTLGATRVLVVVGAEQQQHLAMVFATAKLAGWLAPPTRAEHVAFGAVLGTDGKMFKTRAGHSVRLVDLLEEAVERARVVVSEKNPELDAETRDEVARMVGIGAVKYADLSSDRVKGYVFDYDRMLSFDGNTAPYLQYAHARIRSIFRRSEQAVPHPSAIRIEAPAERALALVLLRFPTAVNGVAESLEPHRLCTYLYDVATAFSTFYEACPVLKADSDEQRESRLALSDVTARVLALGLELLGIDAPERM